MTAGMLAAREWLARRQLFAPAVREWHATILLAPDEAPPSWEFDESADTRFRIEVYWAEWGFRFCCDGHDSWIRVTDVPFVHGRDDFQLLPRTPALKDIASLLRRVEHQHALAFCRHLALVDTNLPTAEPSIREWVDSL